jgi:predicted glycogen debranching enzyme
LEIIVDSLRDFESAISKEWLIANGLGGYASSSILGINTRKYHGLLAVPFGDPPFQRKLLLSKIDESFVGARAFHISSNEYPGVIYPDGYKYLRSFRLDPLPTFFYSTNNFSVKKTIFMPYQRNAVVVNYKIENPSSEFTRVVIYPFVNFRDIHALTSYGAIKFEERWTEEKLEIARDGSSQPFLVMSSDNMNYIPSEFPYESKWYRNFIYREELERGYEFMEDNYCPGRFKMEIGKGQVDFNLLAVGGQNAEEIFEKLFSGTRDNFQKLRAEAVEKLDGVAERSRLGGELRHLVLASDSFLADGKIIAGYHWFGCWGRDSLISLPGLTLVTKRYGEARKVLLDLAGRLKGGLVPNWFEGGIADYSCLDASLLYIYALHKYLSYTDDIELAKKLWSVGLEIVGNCVKGTNEGIFVDDDGLVWGDRGTWMDAKINGREVTPRHGKAVEINALWYNALKSMDAIGNRIKRSFPLGFLADEVKNNFIQTFWNEKKLCLYDVVSREKDRRVRPNQIFAIFLPFPVAYGIHAKKIVETVREKLLTPYGLRSLAQDEPGYIGKYHGNAVERDLAYHQGTVWSWLIGPFITAFVRVGGKIDDAVGFLKRLVDDHLKEAGIGTVSEIFDGDKPHLPRGCISQAWSVAEVLRCCVEDIKGIRPEFENLYGIT